VNDFGVDGSGVLIGSVPEEQALIIDTINERKKVFIKTLRDFILTMIH
jgi:hypothetical protein